MKSDNSASYNSKYIYEMRIQSSTLLIFIAKLMNEFFFPAFLDWRGRLYIHDGPLNFQGGELARSLLWFQMKNIK